MHGVCVWGGVLGVCMVSVCGECVCGGREGASGDIFIESESALQWLIVRTTTIITHTHTPDITKMDSP